MNIRILIALSVALMPLAAQAQELVNPVRTQPNAKAPAGLGSLQKQRSYSMGVMFGRELKSQGMDIDPDALARGIADAFSGKTALTQKQINEILASYQNEIGKRQMEEAQRDGEKAKREGEQFLAKNKNQPGVKTLPSGLQYKVIKQGQGKRPKATDMVTTKYSGKFVNGQEFDSSDKHGGNATFPVGNVIRGWTEALQLMPVGSKWQLYVPAELAYGERGMPPVIAPHSTLVFDVELVDIGKDDGPKNLEQ